MKAVIGTRGSALALWQARYIESELKKTDSSLETEIKIIKTTGDRFLDIPLSKIGDKGLFVKELETSLQNGEIDLAVHSVKDLPSEIPGDLFLAAFTEREDPRDALVTMKNIAWADLPQRAVIGTSSLRRQAQLLHHRPDLKIETLRGNVDTRIRKLEEGKYFGIVLAQAGLNRLGIHRGIPLSFDTVLPSPGQGALAVQMRKDDKKLLDHVMTLNHRVTSICILAERSFLKTTQGGCQIPLGGLARVKNSTIIMEGLLASPDGVEVIREKHEGPVDKAVEIGEMLAGEILARGKQILKNLLQTRESTR